jgi:hypothetical protein
VIEIIRDNIDLKHRITNYLIVQIKSTKSAENITHWSVTVLEVINHVKFHRISTWPVISSITRLTFYFSLSKTRKERIFPFYKIISFEFEGQM